MPRPKHFTITPVDDDNGVAESQTPAAGGVQSLTLTDTTITFATPHKLIITAAADESGRTFTVTGKGAGGQPQTESITGPNATTAESTNYWTEISSITVDDDTAGAVYAGTTGLCASPWYPVDRRSCEFGLGVGVDLSSSANLTYGVEHTFSDIQDSSATIATHDHETMNGLTASADGNYEYPPEAIRMVVSAFTAGTAEFNIIPKG